MKIRNGFVSNSSSSSFMIFGICFDSSTDVFKEAKIEHDEDNDDTDVMTILENEITKRGLNLEVQYAGDSDYVYIGRSWDEVGDNETGLQFKESIAADIKKLFPKVNIKKQVGTHSETYYN